jgi:hypothetical protein
MDGRLGREAQTRAVPQQVEKAKDGLFDILSVHRFD